MLCDGVSHRLVTVPFADCQMGVYSPGGNWVSGPARWADCAALHGVCVMADGGYRDGGGERPWEPRYAILAGHNVVPVDGGIEWMLWFETSERHVDVTLLGRCMVSTVFLGMDHGYDGTALWFETGVFRGKNSDGGCHVTERYPSWVEAEAGHAYAVRQERRSFVAWIDADKPHWLRLRADSLRRVLVVAYSDGHVVLDDGATLPAHMVYRTRRRVPLRKATYLRRFGVMV